MELVIGSIMDGKVTGITKFGAFVSLPGGRSGLVHISEISYSYISEVQEVLKEGQEVKVKVVSVDEAGRINLSIKKAMDPPPKAEGQGRRGGRPGGDRPPRTFGNTPQRAPAAPETFEDRLKLFMQQSDNKLSDLRQAEKRNSRRGGRR